MFSRYASLSERSCQTFARLVRLDLTHPQVRYGAALRDLVRQGCRCLELGAGRHVLPEYAMPLDAQKSLVGRAGLWVGLDPDPNLWSHDFLVARVAGMAERLPFGSGEFDLVVANMVVEHLQNPVPVLREVRRVLKRGGRFLFHTTNLQCPFVRLASRSPQWLKNPLIRRLQYREPDDIFPTYHRLNTTGDVRRCAEASGFCVERLWIYGPGKPLLRQFGPLGWLESLVLKLQATIEGGRLNNNLLALLQTV